MGLRLGLQIAPAAQVGGPGCGCVGSIKILVRALIWALRPKLQFNAGLFKPLIQFQVWLIRDLTLDSIPNPMPNLTPKNLAPNLITNAMRDEIPDLMPNLTMPNLTPILERFPLRVCRAAEEP